MSNYSSAYPELDTYEKLQKDVLKVRKQIGPINQRSSAALIDFMELVVNKIKVVETMPDDDYGSVSAALVAWHDLLTDLTRAMRGRPVLK